MSEGPKQGGALRTWTSTLPVVFLLVVVIAYGTAELLHGQLLALGEHWYPEYHQLRHDPVEPTCDPNLRASVEVVDEDEALLDELLEDDEVSLDLHVVKVH